MKIMRAHLRISKKSSTFVPDLRNAPITIQKIKKIKIKNIYD